MRRAARYCRSTAATGGDGTLAFVTITPEAMGFSFMRADKDGVRRLVVRDGQHEYVFDEVK